MLSEIVTPLRMGRTDLACRLEVARAQREKMRKDLEAKEFYILTMQEQVKQIDDTISACALVAEQSLGIEAEVLTAMNGGAHKAKKPHPVREDGRRHTMPAKDDPTILRLEEVRRFFAENPGTNWIANEIVEQMPTAKREHAKEYIACALGALWKMGQIERVARGVYRGKGGD